jgi:hypothetical protein
MPPNKRSSAFFEFWSAAIHRRFFPKWQDGVGIPTVSRKAAMNRRTPKGRQPVLKHGPNTAFGGNARKRA